MRTPRSAARVVKRIATGVPVPSPRLKVVPPAVVTRRFPTRTNLSNAARSNRSIGRLPPPRQLCPATPATHLESTGVGANKQALPGRGKAISRVGIKTKFRRYGNAPCCRRVADDGWGGRGQGSHIVFRPKIWGNGRWPVLGRGG